LSIVLSVTSALVAASFFVMSGLFAMIKGYAPLRFFS
jgi:hypothetical protein